jgi:hypothetical protein
MSDNEHQSQTQGSSFVIKDIYDQEPGENRGDSGTSSFSSRPNQQPRTQSTIEDDDPSNFNGNTARQMRLESLVGEYRNGRKTKAVILESIQRELEREPQLTAEEKESTLQLCHKEIN